MSDKLTAFIFARGGSKGLPNKNIKILAGKPLIAWSIEQALSAEKISRVIVSTDSENIKKTALEYGAEVPFLRPASLASDESPEILSWRHAINYLKENGENPEYLISIPATSPLRVPQDINDCIDESERSRADVVLCATEAHRNPYFNMIKKLPNNSYTVVNPLSGLNGISRRQDAPQVFDITTVAYVAKTEHILKSEKLLSGKITAVLIPTERAIDIDTEYDFEIADFLMKKRIGVK
jgi:CMP-N-acetylneuraminic acid synthetase